MNTPALKRYGKAVASAVGSGLVVLYVLYSGDQRVDPEEWVQVGIAVTQSVGVWVLPLAPGMRWGKTAVGVLLAVLQVLTTLILGGLDASEWMLLVITAGQAAGVIVAPAVSDNGIGSRVPLAPPNRRP